MDNFSVITGDCLGVMSKMEENSFDACITDPPYGMGMEDWDYSVPTEEIWEQTLRILKPGGFCLSFCSPQLYHRMASAVEDAGFIIKDQIMWMVTTKMPKKNHLKQAHEPIVVAQKPFKGTIKANFEKWGTGIVDVQNTRVPWDGKPPTGWVKDGHKRRTFGKEGKTTGTQKEFGKVDANPDGRYPSNIIGEVLPAHQKYFYAPRVTRKERGEYNDHPTPKPISLMSYLIKVYSPENSRIIDPFCGSGSTGCSAVIEGREFVGIELSEHYSEISRKRIKEYTEEVLS
jgi:site-specific DNA-methyltransferase (adenine-specific)